jgi:hypothetical protein
MQPARRSADTFFLDNGDYVLKFPQGYHYLEALRNSL